jgi:hypothetical protein
MSNGKSYALIIISLIIGTLGAGMGIYSALNFAVIEGPQGDPGEDGLDGLDGVNGTINNVVGVWESIEGGPFFEFELNFSDNRVTESGYFTLDQGVNLTLTKTGWYRFNIKFRWIDLSSTYTYMFYIMKNSGVEHNLVYLDKPIDTYEVVDTYAYVYSDGDDYFRFFCADLAATDSTYVDSGQSFNQFVLEYVK